MAHKCHRLQVPHGDVEEYGRELADQLLHSSVHKGSASGVESALSKGANVDGSRKLGWRPIILAAARDNRTMTELLIKRGANPDLPIPCDVRCRGCIRTGETGRCEDNVRRGTRALHCAARAHHLDIMKALLLAGADPNVADADGITPLMTALITAYEASTNIKMKVVKELLEAGADPAQTSKRGDVALLRAAEGGSVAIMGMLLSRAPGTLNHHSLEGHTALYVASINGNEDVVAFLLAAGAQQPATYESTHCPLNVSVQEGNVEIVRMLLGIGLEAIGGSVVLRAALTLAVHKRRAGILQMILDVAHAEGRPENWETCCGGNRPLVVCAVYSNALTALSVLLAAGADATATDGEGKCALDVAHDTAPGDGPATRAAFARMLERAPAFLCHLWAWPVGVASIHGACASSCVDEVVGSEQQGAPLGVRIFRPKHRKHRNLFARVIGSWFLCITYC